MERYGSLRWILLTVGIVAILALTGMNVYSIYALHQNSIESTREPKKLQVSEFTDKVRYRFYKPFWGLGSADIERLQIDFNSSGQFSGEVNKFIQNAAADSIYKNIYFIPSSSNACQQKGALLGYNSAQDTFVKTPDYLPSVCDGMAIARTQMKALINDYHFNNKIFFDTHRSVTIALINLSKRTVFGYLVIPINQEYVTSIFLPNQLKKRFGNYQKSGMGIWLRDWTNNKIIASNDTSLTYNKNRIQFKQRFPDVFNNWKMEVSFADTPTIEASNSSLVRNLIILGVAVLLLLGALVFMFISAQRERTLAHRQANFLANVSHELKTPIALMQAAGENLADGRVKDQGRLKNYGNHIYNEAVRLGRMIEKLLDVAKTGNTQSLVEPEPEHIEKLLRSYLQENRKHIEEEGFTLDIDINEQLPMTRIDAGSFKTIFKNLIENAIKYSNDDKYIGIKLQQVKNNIELKIEDHGIGMTKKDLSYIFEKFYRAEDPLIAQTKGHGLGLSIVKKLVERNNATIHVYSEQEIGSTFIISFSALFKTPENSSTKFDKDSHKIKHTSFKKA